MISNFLILVSTIVHYGFWYLLLPYLFYQRVICMYLAHFHYVRQKDHVCRKQLPFPILCDIPYFFKYLKNSENKLPTVKWGEVEFGYDFNKTLV